MAVIRNNLLQFTVHCRRDHLVRSLQTSLVDCGGDSCRAPRASFSPSLLAMRERLFVAHVSPRRLAAVIEAPQSEELSRDVAI